jgi:hypothetical protein
VRLRGKSAPDPETLRASPVWQAAQQALARTETPPDLRLA